MGRPQSRSKSGGRARLKVSGIQIGWAPGGGVFTPVANYETLISRHADRLTWQGVSNQVALSGYSESTKTLAQGFLLDDGGDPGGGEVVAMPIGQEVQKELGEIMGTKNETLPSLSAMLFGKKAT